MTPRSRKPVIALSTSNLSQLGHFGGWGRSGSGELRRDATSRATLLSEAGASLSSKLLMKEESFTEQEVDEDLDDPSVLIPIEKMLAKEVPRDVIVKKDEVVNSNDRVGCGNEGCECCPHEKCGTYSNGNGSLDYYSCSSESNSALTGTFRDIVLSRSVLTASPVDLSFSSHTGDFDTSSDREVRYVLNNDNNLSESLLFCLDGNEPSSFCKSDLSCSMTDQKLSTSQRADFIVSDSKEPVDLDYESSGVDGDEEMTGSCSNESPQKRGVDSQTISCETNELDEIIQENQSLCSPDMVLNPLPLDSDLEISDACVQSEIERCLTESTIGGGPVKETSF